MSWTQNQILFFLYSLDFLSGSKKFKILGRKKNFSLVGLILTIIVAIMVIIYSTPELIDYFKRKNFSFFSMEDNSEKIEALKYIGNDTIVSSL